MKFAEECGIFGGVTLTDNVAPYIQQGLQMLQHRGQESAGICTGNNNLSVYKDKGLVLNALNDNIIQNMDGSCGVGHVRYSTQGGSDLMNAQPYMVRYLDEKVAIAHNGNVKAAVEMKNNLEKCGEVFITSSETEMMLRKVISSLCKPPSQWKLEEVGHILEMNFTGGAWSILFCLPERVLAYRDPLGYRPLFCCDAEEGFFIGSEDASFQHLTRNSVKELQPGEAVEITSNGIRLIKYAQDQPSQMCVFEHIYFARPDSNVFGRNVYMSRVELGKKAARENPVDADMVVPVMESGFSSAIGYSQESGIPLQMGLMKNHWIGRTFILPEQKKRKIGVRRKLIPIVPLIEGKKLVLIDDSIVRGTTSREIVSILREAGAKEVHFRTSAPQIVNTCYWGVDIPTKEELIAAKYDDIDTIRNHIGANTLGYLSLEGLKEIFGNKGWCYNCMTRGE
jgi:amidophosphoribosyltransferase